ncbi:MAG TPA: hypothetical protein VIU46_10615 [Gallionellaceae bacterium]
MLKQLRPKPHQRFVVVVGQYSPNPQKAERFLVFSCLGPYLWKAVDVWLTPAGHTELLSRLCASSQVAVGSCDAMYSTKARHVWATVGEELHVWRRGKLIARFSTQQAVIRNKAMFGWSNYPIEAFRSCRGYVSLFWFKRGVALERSLGRTVVVATATESMALIDPTYDGIDLMCDASWVGDLARAISSATHLPLDLDKSLL